MKKLCCAVWLVSVFGLAANADTGIRATGRAKLAGDITLHGGAVRLADQLAACEGVSLVASQALARRATS